MSSARRARPGGRGFRWLAVLGVGVAVAYGGLRAAGAMRMTAREQVAELSAIPRSLPESAGADRLAGALAAVEQSRPEAFDPLGRWAPSALDSAAARLAVAADSSEAGSWEAQEARLALGRIHLYQGRDAAAARVLGRLVAEGGYRAPAARRLLDVLRAGP